MADVKKERDDDDAVTPGDSPDALEVSRRALRRRWELASVLHFLSVFEPVVGKDLKMSAEEIETALITPNSQLAKLHVTLLKGIPPVNKHLSNPDVWVTSLCKKLAEWWPWVAEGEVPLTAAKGEEISKYNELDPTIRLLMLKALCELRTEQDDLMSYINDSLKEGKQPNDFRKDKICEDQAGISYWYDGNSVIGHRLYKEVNISLVKPKLKGKGCVSSPINVEWETLATNLDEFREVLEQFSSHKFGVETMVCDTIETEIIPVLEELEKKKERALKRRQRQDALLNGYQSFAVGVTRSCRARRPVSYTFAEYDRAIDEALKSTRKRKDRGVERHGRKEQQRQRQTRKRGKVSSDGDSEKDVPSEEESSASSNKEGEDEDNEVEEDTKNSNNSEENDSDKENEIKNNNSSDENDTDKEKETNNGNSDSDEENETKNSNSSGENESDNEIETKYSNSSGEIDSEKNETEDEENSESKSSEHDSEKAKSNTKNDEKSVSGSSGSSSHGAYHRNRGRRNPGAKNRVRQRPTRNTAIESASSDNSSENGSSSENTDSGGSGEDQDQDSPAVSDFEDEVQS